MGFNKSFLPLESLSLSEIIASQLCFDTKSFKDTQMMSTVNNIVDNISIIGDKVTKELWKFLNQIRQTNVFDRYTLFYVLHSMSRINL